MRILRRLRCLIAHRYEAAVVVTAFGGWTPAERCRRCRKVRPIVKGRVVAW